MMNTIMRRERVPVMFLMLQMNKIISSGNGKSIGSTSFRSFRSPSWHQIGHGPRVDGLKYL